MIDIKGITFSYPRSGKALFNSFDLTLPAGTIVGLLGKNGAGKTTLLKIITGLQFARSGTVMVSGQPSAERSPALLREVFVVPEELYLPSVSIATYARLYGPLYPRFDRKQFAALLRDFGLRETALLHALSYGQKKKALLAFGIATRCGLLILDEPTNGLDIPSKTQFRNLLDAARDPARLIIVSTHQVRDVEGLIDRVVVLEDGILLLDRDAAGLKSSLSFCQSPTPPSTDTAWYSEPVPGGYAYLAKNETGTPSRLDLELLFNAVLSLNATGGAALLGERKTLGQASPARANTSAIDVFSPRRFRQILSRDVAASWRPLGIVAVSVVALVALGGMFGSQLPGESMFGIALFLGGFLVSAAAFGDLADPRSRMAYLLMPASTLEKFLSRGILSSIGYALATTMLVCAASAVAVGLSQTMRGVMPPLFNPLRGSVWQSVGTYCAWQSLFLAGSMLFRKHAFIKTALSLLLAALVLSVAGMSVLHTGFGQMFVGINMNGGRMNVLTDHPALASVVKILTLAVMPPVLWGFGFLRLRRLSA